MTTRRLVGMLLALVSFVSLGALGSDEATRETPVFTSLGAPTMPFVPQGAFINSTWFCAGAPNGDGLGGSVVITNPDDVQRTAQVTVFSDAPGVGPVERTVEIPGRDRTTLKLTDVQATGSFLSAMVEVTAGGGFVEQLAESPGGGAVSPCSNATSSTWYFAEGYTLGGSTERLVITNPFPGDAILDFGFATPSGSRNPPRLQGFPVKGKSVAVVDVDGLIRDETVLAVNVTSSRGRVVVARAQRYAGQRIGFTMSLGAPSLGSQAYFADGEVGDGIVETYSIYNPTDRDLTVTATFLGIALSDGFANDTELTVPKRSVASLNTADVAGLPVGRHGVVFTNDAVAGTPDAQAGFVVERAITRPNSAGLVSTSVVMGAPSNFAVNEWSMGVGTSLAVDDVLVVLNADFLDATVTVLMLTSGGEVPVPGLEAVALPANGVISIPITDATAVDRALFVVSTTRVFVERRLPRSTATVDLRGRSGSYALPG